MNRRGRRNPRGFTLLEVLVALGIVAIALTTGLRASSALIDNAARQANTLLAHICAENELVRLRLLDQMPGVGETRVPCAQAGHAYEVATTVSPTPNPSFRRIDAQVFDTGQPMLKLSTVVGRY